MNTKKPFETLVTDHGVTVLRVCRSLLNIHDADDAWSETFLAALRAYPALPPSANTEAWLVTIARRKAIDILRTQKRLPIPIAELPELISELGIPGIEDTEIWTCVGKLSEKQRKSITLRFLAGMSYAEIAFILGGSTDAARRAVSDGIKNLKSAFLSDISKGL